MYTSACLYMTGRAVGTLITDTRYKAQKHLIKVYCNLSTPHITHDAVVVVPRLSIVCISQAPLHQPVSVSVAPSSSANCRHRRVWQTRRCPVRYTLHDKSCCWRLPERPEQHHSVRAPSFCAFILSLRCTTATCLSV